jgi:WXG100 family type VII secretion target
VARMAAGESAVDRAAMAQAAQQVEAAVSRIGQLQANMNGYTSQLSGGWQGNAAVAFTRTYEMFSADFAKVLNALQVIHEKLVSTHNTYQATEDANVAQVNQLAGVIGGGATGSGAGMAGGLGKGVADIKTNAMPGSGTGMAAPPVASGSGAGATGLASGIGDLIGGMTK